MYDYKGPTDLDGFIDFALEDYQDSTGVDIPRDIDTFGVWKATAENEYQKIFKVFKKSWLRGSILLGFILSSVYVSWMVGKYLGNLVMGDEKKKKMRM